MPGGGKVSLSVRAARRPGFSPCNEGATITFLIGAIFDYMSPPSFRATHGGAAAGRGMKVSLDSRLGGRAGFTLMEMLVVLAIIAFVASMSSRLLRPTSPRLRVEAAARALCSAARATRVRAVATNQEATLFIDVARKSFSSAVTAETALPSEARVDLSVAGGQRLGGGVGGIVFFPTGGSTGGDVSIELAGARAHVGVNWLTGATTCEVG